MTRSLVPPMHFFRLDIFFRPDGIYPDEKFASSTLHRPRASALKTLYRDAYKLSKELDWVSCLDCCLHCCPNNNNDVPLTALQCWSAYLRSFVKLTMVTNGFSGPCLTAALTSRKLSAKCAAYRMQVRTPTALRHSANAAYPPAAEKLRLHPLQNLPELSSRKEVENRTLVEAH